MDDRIKYRYWINEDWHNPKSKLEPVCCNIVDGCDPTIAISDFEFCTGLKDKNGKLAYENDIVKDAVGNMGIILWDWQRARFIISKKIRTLPYRIAYDLEDIYNYEIIGNIHTNPELLEGK